MRTLTINFEKYHGLGNDFIFLAHSRLKSFDTLLELRNFVSHVCHRRISIGADGVVFVRATKSTQIEVLIVNSDGSLAATCGNALRCLGLKLFRDKKWNGKKPLHVSRLSLPKKYQKDLKKDEYFALEAKKSFATLLRLHTLQNNSATVDISFSHAQNIYHNDEYKDLVNIPISHCVFVQLENPHLVFISDAFKHFTEKEFFEFGQNIQKKYNVNISMLAPDTLKLCVFERGAGLTLACGSGAVASALALSFCGLSAECITLRMPGGSITIIKNDEHIVLSAQVEFAFSGRIRVASA